MVWLKLKNKISITHEQLKERKRNENERTKGEEDEEKECFGVELIIIWNISFIRSLYSDRSLEFGKKTTTQLLEVQPRLSNP